ncbi:hypothetical protein PSPO01_03528 [Paraphaeosphaeria sporulosa]
MSREFWNLREQEIKPGESFFSRALLNGLHSDSKCKHLVILFFVLQLYALQAISTGDFSIAIVTALPAFLLPYTWTFSQTYETILGIPLRFILPYQGTSYTEVKYSPRRGKDFNGPAKDIYLDCFYTLPLYLALWYSYIGTVFPERVTFFVFVAVLFISRHEYWTSHHSFRSSNRSWGKLVAGLKWQFLVGTSTLALWTVSTNYVRNKVSHKRAHPSQLWAIDEGAALVMTCVVLLKVINPLKIFKNYRSRIHFKPYSLYREDKATDEEIATWEMLGWEKVRDRQLRREWLDRETQKEIEEYETVEWRKAEEEKRQRLGPGITNLAKELRVEQAVYGQQSAPRFLYREESRGPQVLYRGFSSDEDDKDYTPQRPPRRPRPAAPTVPLHQALGNKRAQIAARLELTLNIDSAFRERFNKQVKDISAAAYHTPLTLNTAEPPATQSYISIIEDPVALDVDASSSDSDGAETDVFKLEPDYPDSAFPRRAWGEALADTRGMPDYILACWKGWISDLFMFLVQAFAAAMLVRHTLIVTETWPLDPKDGDNAELVKSTWWAIHVVIGTVYAWSLPWIHYWGRAVREAMEFLVNDWFFTVFLVIFAGLARSMWVWYNKGEIGLAFWVVRGTYNGVAAFLNWTFT